MLTYGYKLDCYMIRLHDTARRANAQTRHFISFNHPCPPKRVRVLKFTMADVEQTETSGTRALYLKILYTLGSIDSQKYVVRSPYTVNAEVCAETRLAQVALNPCIKAIRDSSPDFAKLCELKAQDYALYSADFSEEGFPLQSHGRIPDHQPESKLDSANSTTSETKQTKQDVSCLIGRLCSAHFGTKRQEVVEVQMHVLPVRSPEELLLEFQLEYAHKQQQLNTEWQSVCANSSSKADSDFDAYIPGLMSPQSSQLLKPVIANVPASLRSSQYTNAILSSSPVSQRTRSLHGAPQLTKRRVFEHARSDRRKRSFLTDMNNENQCSNCGVSTACTWRRVKGPDGVEQLLCNACGLYYKTKNVMRPSFLWEKLKGRIDAPAEKPKIERQYIQPARPQPQIPQPPQLPILPQILPQQLPQQLPQLLDSQPAPSTPHIEKYAFGELGDPKQFDSMFVLTPEKSKEPISAPASANKWLKHVMSQETSYYDSFLTSPSPKRTRKLDTLALCSSPPTSSTVFSEMEFISPKKRADDAQEPELHLETK